MVGNIYLNRIFQKKSLKFALAVAVSVTTLYQGATTYVRAASNNIYLEADASQVIGSRLHTES